MQEIWLQRRKRGGTKDDLVAVMDLASETGFDNTLCFLVGSFFFQYDRIQFVSNKLDAIHQFQGAESIQGSRVARTAPASSM